MVKYHTASLNEVFSALADPTRRGMLEYLTSGERSAGDLAKPYKMSLPAVSKHLRVLESAGLISRQRLGRVHQLKLEADKLKEATEWMEQYRQFWEGTLDSLADFLEQPKRKPKKQKQS